MAASVQHHGISKVATCHKKTYPLCPPLLIAGTTFKGEKMESITLFSDECMCISPTWYGL